MRPRPLSARQALVLEYLHDAPDPITGREAGAVVHAHQGQHGIERRCPWCKDTGLSILRALKARGMARQVGQGGGKWEAAEPAQRQLDLWGEPFAWPEGF